MNEPLKVGVVGCGYWGPNLIRNLRQNPECQLKVICDASEQRLGHMRRLHPEVSTTRNFEDVLNDAEIDAVVIATPVRFHYRRVAEPASVWAAVSCKRARRQSARPIETLRAGWAIAMRW